MSILLIPQGLGFGVAQWFCLMIGCGLLAVAVLDLKPATAKCSHEPLLCLECGLYSPPPNTFPQALHAQLVLEKGSYF